MNKVLSYLIQFAENKMYFESKTFMREKCISIGGADISCLFLFFFYLAFQIQHTSEHGESSGEQQQWPGLRLHSVRDHHHQWGNPPLNE